MSDRVQELLVRGTAALKAGLPANAAAARYYLERVVRDEDAEPRQKTRAWLYLSQIEEDPARRRICFESALALDPANAEAHQGLLILEGRLKAEDIIEADKLEHPAMRAPMIPAANPHVLVCPKCAAKVLVGAGVHAPVCAYCGTRLEEGPAISDVSQVKEQDFFAALPTAKAHRWEYPTERTLKCAGCGATFVLPPLQVSGVCPFCGSMQVVSGSVPDLIQPDGILPFGFDRAQASNYIRLWIERQRFRPSDLVDVAGRTEPHGAYLPFWTFDLGGSMDWRALVSEGGGERRKWVPQTGVNLVYRDDLLVPASRSISEELSGAYADFDTNGLVPYSAALVAAHPTEVYQLPLAEASVIARQRTLQEAKAYEQKTSLAGKRYRDFVMHSAGMIVESYKLVLLPFWLAAYEYRAQSFPVAVNGQTGTVAGRIPRNLLQRTLASLLAD
jgi:DNA-directed RNA polymerase subunit RPC12/RpoP